MTDTFYAWLLPYADHYNYGAKTHETRCIVEHVIAGTCNIC